MKRLVLFLVAVIVLYTIYYDLNYGTLPAAVSKEPKVSEMTNNEFNGQPYFEHMVHNGDTVLSIIENQLGGSIPVPISDVVSDFKTLNQDLDPQEIQSGKKYKFPDYQRAD